MNNGDIADSIYCVGLACGRDLPDFKYQRRLPKRGVPFNELPAEDAVRRPETYEVEVYSFPQTWGSTALGFGGIGGSSMTTAQTTVILNHASVAVYFGRRHAYTVENFNALLMIDVHNANMVSVDRKGRYSEKLT